ncbi:peroxynitrite isomerase THAP4-like [Culicoides brevitarsis]|uniref:peroxynitrite isomerase THAP4-like n=1 Tax=Culicoides brevitarsis TaxID=469753 RepID=UPI00307CB41A
MSVINPAIEPIKFLIGTWEATEAKGHYPTISDFSYNETLVFDSIGQPLLNYSSKSYHPETNKPMHFESGFLRINPGTQNLAFMVSHNFGLAILEEGTVDENEKRISLESKTIARMSFSKEPEVTGLRRTIQLLPDGNLKINTDMRTSRTDYTNHLEVVYKKKN